MKHRPSDKTRIVIARGGYGNQLFQASLALALQKAGWPVAVDVGWFSHPIGGVARDVEIDFESLGLPTVTLTRPARALLARLPSPLVFKGQHGDVISDYLKSPARVSFSYGQARCVPETLTEAELQRFCPTALQDRPKGDFIAVHVRAADYREDLHARKVFGLTDPTWSIKQGIQLLEASSVSDLKIFTDDPEWTMTFVPPSLHSCVARPADSPPELLEEMCEAAGLVMANSTLSWWAGYFLSKKDPLTPVLFPLPWMARAGPRDTDLFFNLWRVVPRVIL